ncbi:MAG TPA: heparan-alpha-glucosaminide N-acetyltransferase domain-containing protein [Kofleriaceae bacterium]|nr:heparan-alpha-glucosaminide N-acetyltransferase domain-containing protein [Kofleriaceae bacterium]
MTSSSGIPTGARVRSIDVVRGLAMVLMAIDHVRVYSGLPPGGPEPALFFTRWVTHFCAPAFVFLAGASAFLVGRRRPGELSRFLLARGVWLVVLELTVIRLAWTFNGDFAHYLMAGVIWVIGCSMIVMAGLVRLPLAAVGAIGVALVAGHDLVDPHLGELVPRLAESAWSPLWKLLYLGFHAGPIRLGDGGPALMVLYTIVPWLGVMAAGYAFGAVLVMEPARRDRLCLAIGLGAIALFVALRVLDVYGDPRPWRASALPPALAFLDATKYPASLLFLLKTLGPAIAALPLAERVRGAVGGWLAVFGRVPLFFYLLHIPLIHALAILVAWLRMGEVSPWLLANHPMGNPPPPDGYAWPLWLVFATWAAAIALLYIPCLWFADLKRRRGDWWLRYL